MCLHLLRLQEPMLYQGLLIFQSGMWLLQIRYWLELSSPIELY